MIQCETYLKVADNTGAKEIKCIRVPGRREAQVRRTSATSSSRLSVRLRPNGTVKKGEVVKAVIVRSMKGARRADGTYVRFDENASRSHQGRQQPSRHPYFWAGGERTS